MPKRTDAHVISDVALANVQKIVAEAGCASEPVLKDYGEDLIIQSCCNGEMDPFKIWLQVKGTRNLKRYKSKKYGYSLIFTAEHILKWIRSIEKIVVILWDVERKLGLWALPSSEYDFGRLIVGKKNARLLFPSRNNFSITTLERIVWKVRISHYDLIAKIAFANLDDPKFPEKYRQQNSLKLFDIGNLFLNHIGAFGQSGISDDFIKGVMFLNKRVPENSLIPAALIMALLKKTKEKLGEGLPRDLIRACVFAIESMEKHKAKQI